jgi:murein L,D-transpeptidase YcbB/YkuD
MIPARRRIPAAFLAAALSAWASCAVDAGKEPPTLSGRIRDRLSELAYAPSRKSEGLGAPEALFVFYRKRGFEPAWTREGLLLARADDLLAALGGAGAEGLSRDDYHFEQIRHLSEAVYTRNKKGKTASARDLADLDLYCSDAFFLFASHLLRGKVDRETLEPSWGLRPAELALGSFLEDSLFAEGVREALGGLVPGHPHYDRLRRAFLNATGAKNGWPSIRPVPVAPDGETENPAEVDRRDSLRGLRANLERWRWLPHALGRVYILVDVADFRLSLYERDRRVLSMKIVAGTPDWPTPVFTSRIYQIILNPAWVIPADVVLKETKNYILADPAYLKTNKMKVLRGWGPAERAIDPASVDWSRLDAESLDFHIRQEPGPLNVLGTVKFAMTNDFEIYLHDTPYREDFEKPSRGYSHGCVRVEKPVELAARLLGGRDGWTQERLREAIAAGVEAKIDLARPVDVFFQYGTAWVGEDRAVELRPDLYGSDERLARSLDSRPPWVADERR